jgi:hypothetical protein
VLTASLGRLQASTSTDTGRDQLRDELWEVSMKHVLLRGWLCIRRQLCLVMSAVDKVD